MRIIGSICILLILLGTSNIGYSQGSKLHIYGFFDFEVEVGNKDSDARKLTFDQHHLNLLTNYTFSNRFIVATEIEWEHVPIFSSDHQEGKIYLAKALLQYRHSDAFLLRIGKFMSPFGIYNERHDATPTFISTQLAKSVYGKHELIPGYYGRLFAKHSTGIQILGRFFAGNWSAKYQVYLSNGRGPNSGEKDMNFNKGFGWRFVVVPPVKGLSIGTSFYTDKNGYAKNIRQSTAGLDAELDLSSAMIQAEIIYSRIERVDSAEIPNGTFREVLGYYVLGSYTFFEKLRPFARYDYYLPDIKTSFDAEHMIMLGVNFAITQSIYLKAEVHFHRFQDVKKKNFEMFISSIAVAF